MKLKDYQKHIRHDHGDRKNEVWCGEPVSQFDWAFADISHAAYNNLNGGRLLPCPACVKAVTAALKAS